MQSFESISTSSKNYSYTKAGEHLESRKRQRAGGQFSIDELLRQDDKKSKFEVDAKSVSVDEAEPDKDHEDLAVSNDDVKVKDEQISQD